MDDRTSDSGKPSDTEDEDKKNPPDGEGSKSKGSTNRNRSSKLSSRERTQRLRQEEATRVLREITSDPDMMDHVLKAAVNPQVARELARQADVAWRNIETLPGGFRALCQMHQNVQQPLWQAVLGQDDVKDGIKMQVDQDEYSKHKSSLNAHAQPMPNPWSNNSSTFPSTRSATSTRTNARNPVRSYSLNSTSQHVPSSQDARMALPPLFPLNLTSMQNVPTSNEHLLQTQAVTSSAFIPTPMEQPSAGACSSTSNTTTPEPASNTTEAIASTHSEAELLQRYANEMQQLAEMGINDKAKCLVALDAAKGDLFLALGILESLDKDKPKQ